MEQHNVAIFIEAKTKRLTVEAKVEGISMEPMSAELDKMASMIIQVYKCIRDYREGYYPGFAFSESRQIYPMVVTLEDWFLIGPRVKTELETKTYERMKAEGIPPEWLTKFPYTVCSIQDFEQAVQVMDEIGIDRVMRGKAFDSAKQEWDMGAYLKDSFKQEIASTRFLFESEYNLLVPDTLSRQKSPSQSR